MSTKALFRLLFAERYGVEVVFPSMREIAAWLALRTDAVRKELIRREPEAPDLARRSGDRSTLRLDANFCERSLSEYGPRTTGTA